MATAKCYNKNCRESYQSNDPDDLEGFGKCPKCKMNKNIIFETEKRLADRRRDNPLEKLPHFDKRFPKGVPISARDLGIFK